LSRVASKPGCPLDRPHANASHAEPTGTVLNETDRSGSDHITTSLSVTEID
jgi:hypothetical protein